MSSIERKKIILSTPQCEFPVLDFAHHETPRYKRIRAEHMQVQGLNPQYCARKASYQIADKFYCQRHSEMIVSREGVDHEDHY